MGGNKFFWSNDQIIVYEPNPYRLAKNKHRQNNQCLYYHGCTDNMIDFILIVMGNPYAQISVERCRQSPCQE